MTTKQRLVGTVRVPLPPDEAFRLFTPLGERDWVDGWQPWFPAATDDDTAPGTVFRTGSGEDTTIWVVTARERGRQIAYARTTPGAKAGTVTVTLAPADGGSEASVVYELTALTDSAAADLDRFAAAYPDFLMSWQEAIAAAGAV